MKYEWLFFDLDNTILDFDKAMVYALKKTIADFQIAEDDQHLSIYSLINKQCWSDMEKGLISQTELRTLRMKRFLEAIDVDSNPVQFSEDYHSNLSSKIFYLDDAKILLENWSSQYRMILVTNGLKEIQRRRLEQDNLKNHFQHIVISDEIGVAKPHAAFFDYAFEQIGFPQKEKVLIIGDSLSSDIRGGNNYGIDTCWLNKGKKTAAEDDLPTFEIEKLADLEKIISIR